jgi:voltage-gated potassium channel
VRLIKFVRHLITGQLVIATNINGRKALATLPDNAGWRMRVSFLVQMFASRGKNVSYAIFIDLILCGLAYWIVEGSGPIRSLYWAIVTGGTVGYGDFYPKTTPGRGVAVFLIVSMAILIILSNAHVTAWLIPNVDLWSDEEQEELKAEIDEIAMAVAAIQRNQELMMRQLAAIIGHYGIDMSELPAQENP